MILILTIRNAAALQEGMAAQFVVDGPAAVLGAMELAELVANELAGRIPVLA